ncbi:MULTISPECIES: hypothetical protein [Streptomyces]|uniref:hypothetical protein n=1 Tax=Streptomyces TaxID=1883 RepID=UPI0015CF49C9|nr:MULTISPECIES: hypothetical protein [unclassified Streptomyces]WTE25948.1 hypothetical protein OHB50_10065 [Streptomyces anulatus]
MLPEPVVEGEEGTIARYKDALVATDLLIESTRTGFGQFLELKDRSAVDANGEVSYSLTAKGLTAKADNDGSVTFTDAKGRAAGVLPSPVMWDARVDERSGEHTHRAKVGVKVAQDGDTVILTMTPDAGFLAAKDTEFPVTVDPAINIGATFDTFVQQGSGTDQSTATELKIGNTPAALPEGVYKWRSRAGDGSANSAWSGFRTLTVDTEAPAVSKIASGVTVKGVRDIRRKREGERR